MNGADRALLGFDAGHSLVARAIRGLAAEPFRHQMG